MANLLSAALFVPLALSSVAAQAGPATCVRFSWPNVTGRGSPMLTAAVHVPPADVAANGELAPPRGGWPVVVFLHGFGLLGSAYEALGSRLATAGFAAVMLETAQFSFVLEESDARAVFHALAQANGVSGGPWHGAFDMGRVALVGHSMGGAVAGIVAQHRPGQPTDNPGYRCGVAIAPVDPGPIASLVRVPFAIVSGIDDTLTNPRQHADPFYATLAPSRGVKLHYQLGAGADHMSLAGLEQQDGAVFDRAAKVVSGFLTHFLDVDPSGLEAVLGDDGRGDANLRRLSIDTVTPQIWVDRALQVGASTRMSVALESGFGGVLASTGTLRAPLPTLFGELMLDPIAMITVANGLVGSERYDVWLSIPDVPALAGLPLAFQCAGTATTVPFRLGSGLEQRILP